MAGICPNASINRLALDCDDGEDGDILVDDAEGIVSVAGEEYAVVDFFGCVSESGTLMSVVPPTILDRSRFIAPDTSNRWLFRLGGDCKDSAGVGA